MYNKEANSMEVVIHDLEETITFLDEARAGRIVRALDNAVHCQGCFKCWVKNPGFCVYRDHIQHIGRDVGKCDELVFISKITYGGFSSSVKRVVDRSISFSLPLFEMRANEVHHPKRYASGGSLKIYFYGECDEEERDVARRYVERLVINLERSFTIKFFDSKEQLLSEADLFTEERGMLKWES